jgi:hypothetical protein
LFDQQHRACPGELELASDDGDEVGLGHGEVVPSTPSRDLHKVTGMIANNPDSLPFSPISFWYSTRTSLHSTVRAPVNGIQIVYPSGS